jgi:hypothetical protein
MTPDNTPAPPPRPRALDAVPEALRAALAGRIEARRPAMRARALRRIAPDGLPLYRVALDGSGRVEIAPRS